VCVRQASSAAWTWLCTRRWELLLPPKWKMSEEAARTCETVSGGEERGRGRVSGSLFVGEFDRY
jgi:hypothetical protein